MPKPSEHKLEKQLTRKQITHREKDARFRRGVVIGTAVVLGLVVLVLAWGLLDQLVLQPARPVAVVGGVPIRIDSYQKAYRFVLMQYDQQLEQLQNESLNLAASQEDADTQQFLQQLIEQQITQLQGTISNLPVAVYEDLIDDEIVRQECARRGISISSEEIQERLEQQFGYYRNTPTPAPTVTLAETATPTPTVTATEELTATVVPTVTPTPEPTTPPMTEEEFETNYAAWLKEIRQKTGYTEQDVRDLLESVMLRDKLEAALKAEVPTTAEQVHARHILVDTQEEADAALVRLQAGEDFSAVAQELSTDAATKDQGGDLGWFPRGVMDQTFEDAAFGLQPGQLSGVVETSYGFHIILVDEHVEDQELDASNLQTLQENAVDDWFTAQHQSVPIERYWSSSIVPQGLLS